MFNKSNTDFCLEHSVRKRQVYLFRWSVALVNFSPERHEKQCPIHISAVFSLNVLQMEDNLNFFPVKPSEMERNNFRK